MEETPHLEPRLGTPFQVDFDFIQDSVAPMAPLYRPLRSYSNRKNTENNRPKVSSESASVSVPSGQQLRRVGHLTPPEGISPTIPINVNREAWLEDAVNKTKQILLDKESTETFARRLATSNSNTSLTSNHSSGAVESVATPISQNDTNSFARINDSDSTTSSTRTLTRKQKTSDLRTKFVDSKSQSPEPSLLDDDEPFTSNAFPVLEAQEAAPNDKPRGKRDSVVWYDHVYCTCRRAFHPAHGIMVQCQICDEFFHLRCLGQEHLAEHYKDRPFVCVECEVGGTDGGMSDWGMDGGMDL